jgi:hypothetical protein
MIIRVFALYGRNRFILGFLLLVFIAQVAVQARAIVAGVGLSNHPACRLDYIILTILLSTQGSDINGMHPYWPNATIYSTVDCATRHRYMHLYAHAVAV